MTRLLAITLLTISLAGFSQPRSSDTSASCITYWKKGENRQLAIVRDKRNVKAGKGQSDTPFAYEADVLVLDSTSEGYKIQWTFHLPALFKEAHPGLADSLVVFEGMKMLFTTSPTGVFEELLNWRDVRDTYVRMMELTLPKNLDSAAKSALAKTKELFNSREMVESALINEIQLYYFPFGYEFSSRKASGVAELPNPFTDEPLPAVLTYQVTELEPGQDYFKLEVIQEIDSAAAEKVLDAFFKKMNVSPDSSINEAKEAISSLEISELREFYISQSTGWLKTAIYKKTIKGNQVNQSDSYLIRMKD